MKSVKTKASSEHFSKRSFQHGYDQAAEAAEYIRSFGFVPKIAITLGSGLDEVIKRFQATERIPYEKIPHFPLPAIQGHKGLLNLGKWRNMDVAVLEGRVHGYEGHAPSAVVFPVRTLALAGVETFILTCAAGGISARSKPGDFMVFSDHLNLQGGSPLVGIHDLRWGTQFVDLTAAYDSKLRAMALKAAHQFRVSCVEGVYASVSGPTYETPAEICALKILGADAIGMSTVPEVMAAMQLGRRVLAIATITNRAAGLSTKPLTHEDVLAVGRAASSNLAKLLDCILSQIGKGMSHSRSLPSLA